MLQKKLWEHCGEDDCKRAESKRIDPVLKLYHDCPLMLIENEDVGNGQANGTSTHAQQVMLKPGKETFLVNLSEITAVHGVFASQVHSILLRHANKDIVPSQFKMQPKEFSFTTKIPTDVLGLEESSVDVDLKGQQFPLVSNTATTAHKLQGATVENLLVNEWVYSKNWAYVVLS